MGILIVMMFILVRLRMFLDWVSILLLTGPIFVPLTTSPPFIGLQATGLAYVYPVFRDRVVAAASDL